MKNKCISLLLLLTLSKIMYGQQNVGIGTVTPNASALLDIKSSNKGLLIPRINLLNETDVITILNPANSLLIYNINAGLPDGDGYYFWNETKWSKLATRTNIDKQAWGVRGNAGTNTATDFIGTTDNMPLLFKTNNIESGRIDAQTVNVFFGRGAGKFTTGFNNSFFGHQSGSSNLTGSQNTAFGAYSLDSNTTASNNTAIGLSAMRNNRTGEDNTAVGVRALFSNITKSGNISIGKESLQLAKNADNCIAIGNDALSSLSNALTSGSIAIGSGALQYADNGYKTIAIGYSALKNNSGENNLAFGYEALKNNTSGNFNIANGASALVNNTTGYHNISLGHEAMYLNNVGNFNTAIGFRTLFNNTSGSNNIGVGHQTLNQNTTGDLNNAYGLLALYSNTTGRSNTGMGGSALYSNTTGYNNVGVGSVALVNNTNGYYNTAVGSNSQNGNLSGFRNTSVGSYALSSNLNGDYNTAIGNQSGPISASLDNTTAIGNLALVSTSNTMVFGNADVDRWAFGLTTTNGNYAVEVGDVPGNGNGAYLTPGGTWTNTSDANKKEDFTDVNQTDLLQKISQLNIQRWKYKGSNEYHIGPTAQDFYAMFGLGVDDKGISTVDPSGIALAAIKGQQKIINNQNEQIIQLQIMMGQCKKEISFLKQTIPYK
jgi:trimeric autotransporter adhesin